MIILEEIVRDLGPRLYRYFYPVFGGLSAEDLVQEVLVRLIPKVNQKKIKKERGSIVMYAYGIARNVKREALRKNPAVSFDDESALETAVADEREIVDKVSDNITLKNLRRAICRLSEKEREIILLLIDWNLTLNDIAGILKMPLGTVKSHIHRAKVHLKQILLSDPEVVNDEI